MDEMVDEDSGTTMYHLRNINDDQSSFSMMLSEARKSA